MPSLTPLLPPNKAIIVWQKFSKVLEGGGYYSHYHGFGGTVKLRGKAWRRTTNCMLYYYCTLYIRATDVFVGCGVQHYS